MTLGDYISEYRREHKMSMEEFATRCQLSKGYISMLENNRNPKNNEPIAPSLKTFQSVAETTGITLSELLDKLDSKQPISLEDRNYRGNPDRTRIFEIFERLNGRGQHDLRLYAEFLYGKTEYQQARPSKPAIAAYGGEIKYKDKPKKGTD